MKMKLRISIFLLLSVSAIFAQDTVRISLMELESRVLESNLQMRLAQNETELAKAEMLKTRAMYLPDVKFSYTFTATNDPMMAFGLKLNQASITQMDFDPVRLNRPSNINDFGTRLEVMQPIINMDAVYKKKAGNIKTEVLQIKEGRVEEGVRFETQKAYMMLQLAYEMLGTLEQAKTTVLANKKVTDDYYRNGMIQKSDALYMDVRLNEIENQLQFASSSIMNASDFIYFLMDEDPEGRVLRPADKLEYKPQLIAEDSGLSEERKDIMALRKSIESYDFLIKSAKSQFLPRLNAFGSYEFHNSDMFKYDASGYLVGVQLAWNVFDGMKSKSDRAEYEAQRNLAVTELNQYSRQSELELKTARRALDDAENKVTLAETALEQTQEAYRVRKNRFDQGLEKSSDLLMSESMMSQKQLEYEQAVFEYNTAFLYYQFLKY